LGIERDGLSSPLQGKKAWKEEKKGALLREEGQGIYQEGNLPSVRLKTVSIGGKDSGRTMQGGI